MKFFNVKTISYTLAACVLASSISLPADAAVTAGVSSISYTPDSELGFDSYSTLAGVNLSVNNVLTSAIITSNATIEENAATAVAVSEYANVAIANVDNFVYIRTEASADSDKVGKLYSNSAATVHETVEAEDGTWVQITSGNCTGYIKAEYLIIGDEELAKSVSRRLATITGETVYVREEPSTDSEVLDSIAFGEDLTVLDESMIDIGWVQVSSEGGDGYISADYVTLSTEYTLAESVAEEAARLAKEEAAKKAAAAAAAKKQAEKVAKAVSNEKSYSAASGSGGQAVVNYACQFVGNPYVYGGSSLTNGTDCSGFVMSVYAAFGVSLPHSSSGDRSVGYEVSLDSIQPGDIVCYSGHVGIYAGNGQIVHASNRRTGITYSSVTYRNIITIRRIF